MPQKNRIFAIFKSQSIRQAPTKIPEEPTEEYTNLTSPANFAHKILKIGTKLYLIDITDYSAIDIAKFFTQSIDCILELPPTLRLPGV